MKDDRSKFSAAGGEASEKDLSDPAVMLPYKPLSAAFLEDAHEPHPGARHPEGLTRIPSSRT